MSSLTHIDGEGRASMVDVSDKSPTSRRAVAEGFVTMNKDTLALIEEGQITKGSVISVAELAAIMGAKKTADLIPLCHPLPLSKIKVEIITQADLPGLRVVAEVKTKGPTGVEMEALTAVSVACLTIYDMAKAAQKDMIIGPIRLLEKQGGKSGDFKVG